MFLSNISIKRPIMISMFLIAFVVFGALAYFGLTLNMMPDVDIPVVTVQTIYPGAGPNEMEIQVTKKIEEVYNIKILKETDEVKVNIKKFMKKSSSASMADIAFIKKKK